MLDAEAWVPLAEVARPHGVKGELRLRPYNRDSDLLLDLDEVLVRFPGGEAHEVSVDGARRANDAILMKLFSVDDREGADALRGALVCARRRDFPPLDEGEFYACDIEGAQVVVEGEGARAKSGGFARSRAIRPRTSSWWTRPGAAPPGRCPSSATWSGRSTWPRVGSSLPRWPASRRNEGLRVDVVTLFPELFAGFLATSFVGRAVDSGALAVRLRSPRDFGLGKHKSVDDTPYGGGSGMVMRVDVLASAIESLDADAPGGARAHRVLLTPQGTPLDQRKVHELAARPAVMLVCGRYEGFDERIRGLVDEEVSLGDFVMTGGEVAAMAVVEACVRLLPGVLGNEASTVDESHSPDAGGLLEYPQYTRPPEYRGARVPEVLVGGHHAEIAKWRRAQALERTRTRRPDLWERFERTHPEPAPKAARGPLPGGGRSREGT